MQFKQINPVLPVRDVAVSAEYYTKLGFRVTGYDDPSDPRYAVLVRDQVEIHLQWHAEADFDLVEKLMLRFVIEDIDALFAEYEPHGVFHDRTALRDTPWGTREFAFYDLDKNGLTFYKDMPAR